MALLPWQIWMIIGIGFIIIEIFDPAFFFISLGIGAIITSLLSLIPFMGRNIAFQILIFAVLSFISFLFMRKLGKKLLANTGSNTNVFALKGKNGIVTKEIPLEGKGYVKIGGEEWPAVEVDQKAIELGAKVIIEGIDGNKVIVRKI
ncbi:MAG: NfeD family protein [Candidatus Cloacimonetes bacterium]|nr:NfeD family protein [Candidatus Cloacimonadota bacterium]MDD4676478.1 NfeD family protein [Candidatus Cloacimonadota bacterium]